MSLHLQQVASLESSCTCSCFRNVAIFSRSAAFCGGSFGIRSLDGCGSTYTYRWGLGGMAYLYFAWYLSVSNYIALIVIPMMHLCITLQVSSPQSVCNFQTVHTTDASSIIARPYGREYKRWGSNRLTPQMPTSASKPPLLIINN